MRQQELPLVQPSEMVISQTTGDLNTFQGSPGNWDYIYALDIDAILAGASPPQTVSSTFQFCFGQQDNFPATSTTELDEFTVDDIVIDGEAPGLWIGTSSADNIFNELCTTFDGHNFITGNLGCK